MSMHRQPHAVKPLYVDSGNRLQPKLEASAWLFLALATLVYGNGKNDFVTVVLHHPEICRFCIPAALSQASVQAQKFGSAGELMWLELLVCSSMWQSSSTFRMGNK